MTKTCTKCHEAKPVSEFYPHRRMKDGYFTHCKTCVRLQQADYQRRNRDMLLEKRRRKYVETDECTRRKIGRYAS